MTNPGEVILIVKSIGDVQPSVNDHLVSEATTGIYPSNSRPPTGPIIDDVGFNSPHLCRVGNFIFPFKIGKFHWLRPQLLQFFVSFFRYQTIFFMHMTPWINPSGREHYRKCAVPSNEKRLRVIGYSLEK